MRMKFAQRKAGKAHRRHPMRLGRLLASPHLPMTSLLPRLFISMFLLLLALPAAAQAADPLLSGYAGPGGGEQVVLGGATVGGGGGPKSGGRGGAVATADESLRAPTTPAVASRGAATLTGKPQKRKSGSSSASHEKTMPGAASTGSKSPVTTTRPGAPVVVAYPTRAGAVSGLPISAGGVVALLAAIALLVLAGLGLRRVISPQVSAG
jgi:hypothetical protein